MSKIALALGTTLSELLKGLKTPSSSAAPNRGTGGKPANPERIFAEGPEQNLKFRCDRPIALRGAAWAPPPLARAFPRNTVSAGRGERRGIGPRTSSEVSLCRDWSNFGCRVLRWSCSAGSVTIPCHVNRKDHAGARAVCLLAVSGDCVRQWATAVSAPAPACVVVCVVTLPSLPVSSRLCRCHSGTQERQRTCPKPA